MRQTRDSTIPPLSPPPPSDAFQRRLTIRDESKCNNTRGGWLIAYLVLSTLFVCIKKKKEKKKTLVTITES